MDSRFSNVTFEVFPRSPFQLSIIFANRALASRVQLYIRDVCLIKTDRDTELVRILLCRGNLIADFKRFHDEGRIVILRLNLHRYRTESSMASDNDLLKLTTRTNVSQVSLFAVQRTVSS